MKKVFLSLFLLTVFIVSFINIKTFVHNVDQEKAIIKNTLLLALADGGDDCTKEVFKDNCNPSWENIECTVKVNGTKCHFTFATIRQE